jgi:hypothetical protein
MKKYTSGLSMAAVLAFAIIAGGANQAVAAVNCATAVNSPGGSVPVADGACHPAGTHARCSGGIFLEDLTCPKVGHGTANLIAPPIGGTTGPTVQHPVNSPASQSGDNTDAAREAAYEAAAGRIADGAKVIDEIGGLYQKGFLSATAYNDIKDDIRGLNARAGTRVKPDCNLMINGVIVNLGPMSRFSCFVTDLFTPNN